LEELVSGAIQRGLALSAFDDMEVGSIVDFVILYNNAHDKGREHNNEEEKTNHTRKATQDDWEKFSM
jgi:hypothetical protein